MHYQVLPQRKGKRIKREEEAPSSEHLGQSRNSDKLVTGTVILHRHEQTREAKQPGTHFQVPSIVISASPNINPRLAQIRFERFQSFIGIAPMLGPNGKFPRPGHQ